MQALAGGGFQTGMVGMLVVPGLERGARLHGRKDMNQTGMVTALGEDALDTLFFSKGLVVADKLDFQACLTSQLLGVLTKRIA